ncbi:MAG: hypothetical protein WBF05_06030, partial [Anaerolineales bacterium]
MTAIITSPWNLPWVANYGLEDLLNLPRVVNNWLMDFTLPLEVIYLQKLLNNPREVRVCYTSRG